MSDVPEFRRDPLAGRWSLVAPHRTERPNDYGGEGGGRACPFCPGNENQTPPEVYAVRPDGSAADGPGWTVRVVPNKYPAVVGDTAAVVDEAAHEALFQTLPGVGGHEVVIESARHVAGTEELSPPEVRNVFDAYRRRLSALSQDPAIKYALVFKNVGQEAGASLEHAHSQLVAMSLVPDAVRQRVDRAEHHHRRHGRCLCCDLIADELERQVRIVETCDDFVAFCPYAGRFPYETWVVPRQHAAHFHESTPHQAETLGRMVQSVLTRMARLLDRPAYNYLLDTAPFDSLTTAHYHWHVEIMPRLTKAAGFEWATGVHINPVTAEDAAARLAGV